jgi:hypothetical protein
VRRNGGTGLLSPLVDQVFSLSQHALYAHTNHFSPSPPNGTTVELHDTKPPTQPHYGLSATFELDGCRAR